MKTTTKNTVLIYFSDGQRTRFATSENIPSIRETFKIGKSYRYQEDDGASTIQALTIN